MSKRRLVIDVELDVYDFVRFRTIIFCIDIVIRERFGESYDAAKFWQELGWRQFWRLIYARLGNQIYEDLETAKVPLRKDLSEELPEDIQQGRTGLVCMDETVRELVGGLYP